MNQVLSLTRQYRSHKSIHVIVYQNQKTFVSNNSNVLNIKLFIYGLNFKICLSPLIIISILLSVSDILILIASFRRLTSGTSINAVANGGEHSSVSDVEQPANYRYGRPKEHAFQRPVPV